MYAHQAIDLGGGVAWALLHLYHSLKFANNSEQPSTIPDTYLKLARVE